MYFSSPQGLLYVSASQKLYEKKKDILRAGFFASSFQLEKNWILVQEKCYARSIALRNAFTFASTGFLFSTS